MSTVRLAHRKQPDMVHHRLPAVAVRPRIARAADHIRGLFAGPQTVEQDLEFFSLGRIEHIIGVQPEGINAFASPVPRARRGEVIDPDEIEDPGPELAGDLPRAVGAAVSTTTISSNSPAMEPRQ